MGNNIFPPMDLTMLEGKFYDLSLVQAIDYNSSYFNIILHFKGTSCLITCGNEQAFNHTKQIIDNRLCK